MAEHTLPPEPTSASATATATVPSLTPAHNLPSLPTTTASTDTVTASPRRSRSVSKPQTPRSKRSTMSSTSSQSHTAPPSTAAAAATAIVGESPKLVKSEPRKRKPTFVSCLSYPEAGPAPPPPITDDADLQRSQRKSKVEALNKLDRVGTPTALVAGPSATSFLPPPPPPAIPSGPSVLRNPLKRTHEAIPPFDLSTVRTTAPRDPGPSKEPRAFGLPECPAYHPTPEQFLDPMAYIESIAPEAKRYGICKIVPPKGWQMPFELETDRFKFRTRVQRLNSIEAASRAKINFLEQLSMFHHQQGDSNAHIPIIDRKLLDLWRLRKEVNKVGGIDEINRLKAWTSITELLGYDAMFTSHVRAAYMRIILPFENFALRARSASASPLTPLPSTNGKLPGNAAGAFGTPDTPTRGSGRMNGMRTSPRSRMAGMDTSQLTAMSMGPDVDPLNPGTSSDALAPAAPIIRIKVPGFTRSDGSESELSEAESTPRSSSRSSDVEPGKYEKGEVCEICGSGHAANKILLCDGCDRGFHTYCLDPPLPGVPANEEWFCTACLLGTGDDYGFDEGEDHSLTSFQARDAAFTEAWFNRYAPITYSTPGPLARTVGNTVISEVDVEREFWRLVESQEDTVEVEYGADVHSTTHGSAAPTLETHPTNSYSRDPWNLNNMPILHDSLLRYIKSDISGMTVPWIYVGMLFSTFCWHNEDHYTYSVNYMFWGETKTWYGVPGDHAEKLEAAIKSEAPELFEQQPSLLYQLVTMMNPGRLRQEGVDVFACDQRPNEFVITFPKAYHCGFNHGINFNEAVNFALPDWLPEGKESVVRYKQHLKAPVFSHNELLITITLYSDTIKTALWLESSLREMVEEECARRAKIRASIPALSETLVQEDVPEDQYQCCVCKGFCYLSQVTCTCTKLVTCMDHAEHLCPCPMSQRHLRMRYSENQLEDILDVVVARAAQPEQWRSRLDALLEVPRPPLKSMRALVSDGERIPHHMQELSDLRALVARANAWVERATALGTRKSTGRRRKSRPGEGDEEDLDRRPEALKELLHEANRLAFDAPEILQLRQMLFAVENFRSEAAVILSTPESDLRYDQCRTALILGESLNIDLPEVTQLSVLVARLEWYHKIEEEVDDRTIQYEDILMLLDQAEEYGVPPDHRAVVELKKRAERGLKWKQSVDELMASSSISLDDVSALIEGKEDYTPTSIETMRSLESLRKTALNWQASAQTLLTSTNGSPNAAARICKAVRLAQGALGRVNIPEIAALQAELDFNARWAKELADLLGSPINKLNVTLSSTLRHVEEHLIPKDDRPNDEHACFCRGPAAGATLVCSMCQGCYHPKCVGHNARTAAAVVALPGGFKCQMCEHLQYDDRPSLHALARFADPVKWNFVLVPPETAVLETIVKSMVRFAALTVPIIDPLDVSTASNDPVLVSHLLRKIWTLPIVCDAVNVATNELIVFEEWLYRRFRDALDGPLGQPTKAPRQPRARRPKIHLAQSHPNTFACVCKVEPLDHLLTATCTKCGQGFHLSCAKAPLSVMGEEGRTWRCPCCVVKESRAAPKGVDLRVQMKDKLGTDEFVDWRQTIYTYAETPVAVHLPPNHDALVLTCDQFTPPTIPDGFERPVWVQPAVQDVEEPPKKKRRKQSAATTLSNDTTPAVDPFTDAHPLRRGHFEPPNHMIGAAPPSPVSLPALSASVSVLNGHSHSRPQASYSQPRAQASSIVSADMHHPRAQTHPPHVTLTPNGHHPHAGPPPQHSLHREYPGSSIPPVRHIQVIHRPQQSFSPPVDHSSILITHASVSVPAPAPVPVPTPASASATASSVPLATPAGGPPSCAPEAPSCVPALPFTTDPPRLV